MRSVKIPLGFLITGILWALFSSYVIMLLTKGFSHDTRQVIRSLNNLAFVATATIVLYFEIKKQHKKLSRSEDQYRRLFELNPNPMWVYSTTSLRFVKVNVATVYQYGYSMDELLNMTVAQIRPPEEHDRLMDYLDTLGPGVSKPRTWVHRSKSGELMHVSIVTYDLDFNNEPCRLVMATNITDIILKEEKIKAQNAALHEIAWLNSHEVRRALCSVISLTELVKDAAYESERREYILLLQQCTSELDEVLKKTNNKVDELKEF
jgi:PAS domain S-box-containing protein